MEWDRIHQITTEKDHRTQQFYRQALPV